MNKFTEGQQKYFDKLVEGQKIIGQVTQFRNFGAIVKIGLITGFINNENIDYGRVTNPEDYLKQFKKLELVIIKIDKEKQHVNLSLKQLKPDPWLWFTNKYKVNDFVNGNVVDVKPYGAFIEIKQGVEGLIHMNHVDKPEETTTGFEYFTLGENYEAKIISIDENSKRIGLSLL